MPSLYSLIEARLNAKLALEDDLQLLRRRRRALAAVAGELRVALGALAPLSHERLVRTFPLDFSIVVLDHHGTVGSSLLDEARVRTPVRFVTIVAGSLSVV